MSMVPKDVTVARSGLADRLRRYRRETRGGGLPYALHRIFRRLVPQRFLDIGAIHIFALDLQAIPVPAEGPIRIRPAEAKDTQALAARLRRKEAYFHRGSQFWVAEQSGRPIAYDISGARTKDLTRWIKVEASERDTWGIVVWVAPEARGQGLAGQLRSRVAQHFREAGLARYLGTIDVTNTRSVRTFKKLGAEFIGRVYFAWLFGFGVVFFDGRLRAGYWSDRQPLILPVPPNSKDGLEANRSP